MKKMLYQADGLRDVLEARHDAAVARYDELYDNTLYRAAVGAGLSSRGGWLQDRALAICGSPYETIHLDDRVTDAEIAFLARFV